MGKLIQKSLLEFYNPVVIMEQEIQKREFINQRKLLLKSFMSGLIKLKKFGKF